MAGCCSVSSTYCNEDFQFPIRHWKKAVVAHWHFQESPKWIKAKYGGWVAGGVIFTVIVIDCHCQSCSVQPWEMNTAFIDSVFSNSDRLRHRVGWILEINHQRNMVWKILLGLLSQKVKEKKPKNFDYHWCTVQCRVVFLSAVSGVIRATHSVYKAK